MKNTPINIPYKVSTKLEVIIRFLTQYLPPKNFCIFLIVLGAVSAVSSINFTSETPLLLADQVAPRDIIANRSLIFEDTDATKAEKELAHRMEPLICTLSPVTANACVQEISTFFKEFSNLKNQQELYKALNKLEKRTGTTYSQEQIKILGNDNVQKFVFSRLIPYLSEQLHAGVLPDLRIAYAYAGGVRIIIQDKDQEIITDAHSLTDLSILKDKIGSYVNQQELLKEEKDAINSIVDRLLIPTITPDIQKTNERKEHINEDIPPIMIRIQQGEIIAHKGEKIDFAQQLKIKALWKRNSSFFNSSFFIGTWLCSIIISMGLLFSPDASNTSKLSHKDYVLLSFLIVLFSSLSKGVAILGSHLSISLAKFSPDSLAFAVPVAAAASLAALIFSRKNFLVISLLISFFCTVMVKGSQGGLGIFLYYLLSCLFATWITSRIQTRQDFVWSTIPLSIYLLSIWLGTTFLQGGIHTRYFSEAILVLSNTVISLILTVSITPAIEMLLGYTTRFRLMELFNLEQPLLRDLMFKAPGTYHHSLIVSAMSEEGAKSIGANTLLCKVAALYHDIGKTEKANYFIENQLGQENPHDKLSPSMSALVLISHTKLGAELAQKHRLGKEISDVIKQHHGTTIIQYFYQKALKSTDTLPPKEDDFRYPGPRPQTKEAAIVMLADICEASSRSLGAASHTRLYNHIENIIKKTYESGQLDDTSLTLSDLNKLIESFHLILRGLFHSRISYPDSNDKKSAQPSKEIKNEASNKETNIEAKVVISTATSTISAPINPIPSSNMAETKPSAQLSTLKRYPQISTKDINKDLKSPFKSDLKNFKTLSWKSHGKSIKLSKPNNSK